MAGILQLNQSYGDDAQSFYDETEEARARQQIFNIQTKAANKQELGYFVGRGISAGGQTLKDYRAGPIGDDGKPNQGFDKGGTFHGGHDFAQNFFDPYAKYDKLRTLGGYGNLPTAPSQPGVLTGTTQHNAQLVGDIHNALIDPDWGSAK